MKFKEYHQYQERAFPIQLEEFIRENNPARLISDLVDKIDLKILSKSFNSSEEDKGGNRPYHPGMMLKILIYSYMTGIYSCRKIADQLEVNVVYMWLSGNQHPDFRTINRYRTKYLGKVIPKIFQIILQILSSKDKINLDAFFIDGTKLEANSNKHKVVWGNMNKYYKNGIKKRTQEFLSKIDSINDEEMKRYGELELMDRNKIENLSSQDLNCMAKELSESLKVDGKSSKTKAGKLLREAAYKMKNDAKKMVKYEQQDEILKGRKSFSKTDPDATVMKMKNDELRPGYNVQVATDGKYIVDVDVCQNSNDGSALMQTKVGLRGKLPKKVVADAGYGQAEIYQELTSSKIKPYIKYPGYERKHSNYAENKFHHTKFVYRKEEDIMICPLGKKLYFEKESSYKNATGRNVFKRTYQCYDCNLCEFRELCTNAKIGRSVSFIPELRDFQQEIDQRLNSEEGKLTYKKRSHAVETVFGQWKYNEKFRRFSLRGLENVRTELFLKSIAYNIKRYAKNISVLSAYFFRIYVLKIVFYPNLKNNLAVFKICQGFEQI